MVSAPVRFQIAEVEESSSGQSAQDNDPNAFGRTGAPKPRDENRQRGHRDEGEVAAELRRVHREGIATDQRVALDVGEVLGVPSHRNRDER